MKTLLTAASLLISFALAGTVAAQTLEETIMRASQETLVSMPEPPLGYSVAKHPLVAGETLIGFQVQVMHDEGIGKVLVKVEFTDRSERASRVAACKGYVNGFATELKGAGFKVTASKIPDIEKSDFKTPLVVDLTFANDEGATIFVQKQLFFTAKGYDVTVISGNEEDLKLLSAWAAQIRPAAPTPRR